MVRFTPDRVTEITFPTIRSATTPAPVMAVWYDAPLLVLRRCHRMTAAHAR
ncbi:hypothetical protein P7H15_26075 [Paenibacillus larvae]|nr:hypothetical protein [Paenibacillus larvae]MDT2295591.1 hypothetical protein [Paenibacillus larvae]